MSNTEVPKEPKKNIKKENKTRKLNQQKNTIFFKFYVLVLIAFNHKYYIFCLLEFYESSIKTFGFYIKY